jgi:hypothetical protein
MGLGDVARKERKRVGAGPKRTYTNEDLGHTKKWREITGKDAVYSKEDTGARFYGGDKKKGDEGWAWTEESLTDKAFEARRKPTRHPRAVTARDAARTLSERG